MIKITHICQGQIKITPSEILYGNGDGKAKYRYGTVPNMEWKLNGYGMPLKTLTLVYGYLKFLKRVFYPSLNHYF